MPPAAITGIDLPDFSSISFIFLSTSLTSFLRENSGLSIWSGLKPRCPPAFGPSTTIASGA
jgi:hypothetical protein